jgi:hypothetical protein
LFFIDANKDQTIRDDAIMSSSLPIMPIQNEELEETPIYVNVSQRSHENKPIERVVHT